MANSGIVKSVAGDVKVIAIDETERILKIGERVLFNDRIITGDTGVITIEFSDGTSLGLGTNANIILSEALNLDLAAKPADREDHVSDSVQDEVAAIQQTLAEDQTFDPSKLEAPAAGGEQTATEGGENSGHSIIGVDYLNPQRTPGSGFETNDIGPTLSLDLAQPELILEPGSLSFAPPTVQITDHNGSELGDNRRVEGFEETISGTFVLDTPAGLASITVAGQIITETALLNADEMPIEIDLMVVSSSTGGESEIFRDILAIDGFDATSGTVNYSLSSAASALYGAVDHSDGDESVVVQIGITVTDSNNVTSVTEILDILTADTAPVAIDNVENMFQGLTWFSDNVIFNLQKDGDTAADDIFAVDETRLQSVTFNDVEKDFLTPGDLVSNDLGEFIEFNTENGRLLIGEDGQYWYRNADLTDGEASDSFQYQLADADGDISVATLTINQVIGENINTGVDAVFV